MYLYRADAVHFLANMRGVYLIMYRRYNSLADNSHNRFFLTVGRFLVESIFLYATETIDDEDSIFN